MEEKKIDKAFTNGRLQNIIENFAKCKIEYTHIKEECKKLKDIKTKLEEELKEFKELEKSHRCDLQNTREMVENLQQTVSNLVYIKRDTKKLNEEIISRGSTIATLEKEKEVLTNKHNDLISKLRISYEKQIEEIRVENEKKVQQLQHEVDIEIAQHTYLKEELRTKLNEMEEKHRDEFNMMVLEYEEKNQQSVAQITQLQEQLARQTARNDANLDAYRRKVEDLEEKLKQIQFKEFLAQTSSPSVYDNVVERPYSVNKDPYIETAPVNMNRVLENPKPSQKYTYKLPRATNPLHITYSGNTTPNIHTEEKKGQCNITKKRKLYTDKGFQDF
ncbi:uncharacterized protein PF3D7_1120000-like [Battus philenor]|uniref:uncharacterized protein PF3D7_1120000-like n=1 Tax=Battus philenor TaxID=42288 RepID=UPI0035D05902